MLTALGQSSPCAPESTPMPTTASQHERSIVARGGASAARSLLAAAARGARFATDRRFGRKAHS
eukprot:scaffold41935_cov75-Phaeocystis_antarctica.AAC.3